MSPPQSTARKPKKGAGALIEAFLEMMSAERGAGANTLAAYRHDLLDFAGHPKNGLAGASRDEIKAYLRGLSASGIAASSQARRLSALRQFYGFLFAEEMRPDNPTDAVDSPRATRPLPKILSAADMEAMIAAAAAAGAEERRGQAPAGDHRDAVCGGPARFRAGGPAAGARQGQGWFRAGGGQGRQGAAGAAQSQRAGGDRLLSGCPRRIPAEKFAARRALSFLFARQGRFSHPPAACTSC